MIQNEDVEANELDESGFESFEHAAADIVLATSFNPAGTRIVLCSADHRIRVYDISPEKEWTLIDKFRGHNAEILDVQWLSCSLGQFFATIGGDNRFKIWSEDPSQRNTRGRRFRNVYTQTPPNHVSYVSFGFKTMKHDTYLALLTHDGLFSLSELSDPEKITSWTQIDHFYPFGHHHRGTEARFRLSFQQSEGPSSNALLAGVDLNTMSIAISAMNFIKVFRGIKPTEPSEGNYQFYEVIEVLLEGTLVNEIAWAPGSLRPYDVIAAACDDSTVRIINVDVVRDTNSPVEASATRPRNSDGYGKTAPATSRKGPSGIGAGLAGIYRLTAPRRDNSVKSSIIHEIEEVAALPHDDGSPVWKVRWLYDGSTLASTGDNGKVHLWRENFNGDYIEFAETEPA